MCSNLHVICQECVDRRRIPLPMDDVFDYYQAEEACEVPVLLQK
ncbi:MAG: hypothetical protein ACLU00_01700 [Mediterraneibacter faecis]